MNEREEKVYIGINVSKTYLDVYFDPTRETIRVKNDDSGIKELSVSLQDEVLKSLSLKPQSSHPLVCLQRKISTGLDLKAAETPSPPLLIWTKAPAVFFQFLDLNVPPVSSDLVGHKLI